jgi:PAS domain S-box-containing protein
VEPPALANPAIQQQLLAEALQSANVGFLVWDEHRRYIAANDTACDILGASLAELLGQPVGAHTADADVGDLIATAISTDFVHGTATVERFDGRGAVRVFYATFTTKSAGMPFMATVIARIPDDVEAGMDP